MRIEKLGGSVEQQAACFSLKLTIRNACLVLSHIGGQLAVGR